MNRYIIRILAALIALVLGSCADDVMPVPLHATWQFEESSGGLLGPITADPDDLWFLEFTNDGRVIKWDYDGKADEYYYRHIFLLDEIYLEYKYKKDDSFQLFHKAELDGNQLTLIPFMGKNTSCDDCPTQIFRKVEHNW